MTIDEVRALYFDENAVRVPPYTVYRVDGGDNRWYYREDTGRYYASVTSVIRSTTPTPFALIQWMMKNGADSEDIRDERAAYGTWLHMQIADLLINRRYNLDMMGESIEVSAREAGLDPRGLDWYQEGQKDMLAFAQFMRDHSVEPIAIEGVYTSDRGYAGAIDLVCRMKIGSGAGGKFIKRDTETGGTQVTAIVDFKSGRKGFYDSHEIQLHMYRDMWHENNPDVPVDRVFNWSPKSWTSSPSYNLKDQTESRHAAKIPHLLALFAMDAGDGPPPRLSISGEITPDIDLAALVRREDIRSRANGGVAV